MTDTARSDTVPSGNPQDRRILVRNLMVMMVWQTGNYLAPLMTFPYLTRVLGPVNFGVLGYATAIATYGALVTEWGFFLSGPRAVVECRENPDALNELIWSTIGAKACLCALSCAGLWIVLHADEHIASARPIVLASWLMVVSNVFTLNWLLQGLEQFSLFTVVSLAGRFVTLPLTFLFVHREEDVAAAAAIQASAAVVTGAFSVCAAWRLGVMKRPRTSVCAIRRRICESTELFVSSASVSLFSTTNAVILTSLVGSYQAGIYAAADRIKTAANMVPAQINTVLYPRIAALLIERRRTAAKLAAVGAVATVMTTAGGVAVFSFLSEPFTVLLLGRKFIDSASVLKILCFATLFGNLAYFLGLQVLIPFGASRMRSLVMLVAGCLNVVLALITVPRFGAEGAAASFLISEIAILAAYLVMIVRKPEIRAHFLQLLHR
ncbi:oligosaccharide flippase family protein [Paraburkholderia sp. CNPSo 3157]|uniref:Oligosaccharide flippase family protein n=1 Tax=Paraburkholderia franconis TaxID=2654983 RepID=A0A7X1TIV3_9BURK|nr:oligosaccharide flippase family protein [Paraburkholderia franconis]